MVEPRFSKPNVASSSLVFRSNFIKDEMKLAEVLVLEEPDHDLETVKTLMRHMQLTQTPEEVTVMIKKHAKSRMKACFNNASNYVLAHKNCSYVLGYYLFHGLPIEHAWVRQGDFYLEITLNDHHEGDRYFKVIELSPEQLKEINAFNRQKGPDFYAYSRFNRRKTL